VALAVMIVIVGLLYVAVGEWRDGEPTSRTGALCADKRSSASGVRVDGNRFVSDGKTWYPRGLNIVRFVAHADVAVDEGGSVAESLDRWNRQECVVMKEFGANVLRIQVGQPTIDPASQLYDAGYFAMINQRVREALDSGFVVSLSLQWEKPESAPRQSRPDVNSQQIWQKFATAWGDDTRVIFELYNEPKGEPTAENWKVWLRGGPYAENPSGQSVGIQTLIDTVRDAGAKNVLLLPGLKLQKSLERLPVDEVVDPLNNFGFAFHTPNLTRGVETLEERIGYLADDYPLWATEQVGASSWSKCYEHLDEDYAWYFPWLAKRGIGVTAPWDRRAVWGGVFGRTLTTMDDFSCRPIGEGTSGPGELFHDLFQNGYPN